MKISIYLKSGQIIDCYSDTPPELTISSVTGELLSYNISDIVGKIQPIYVNISEINAIVTDTSNSETVVM